MSLLLANSLVDLFHRGGPIMWPIALLTLFAVAITTERCWWWLQLSRKRDAEGLEEVLISLDRADVPKALQRCANSEDPVLRVIHAGLTHRHASLQGALQAASGVELRQAGRFLTAMDTIITLAPLLGLLGTVTGIMDSFSAVGGNDLSVDKVSGGIGEALIATAFGLGIAIFTLIPYNWLNAKVVLLQHDLEIAASNLEVLTATGNVPKNPAA